MASKALTVSVIGEEARLKGKRPVIERVMEGEEIPFSDVEEYYRRPGGTLMHALFGADFFDFWIGRFYVGTFGALSLIGIVLGTIFYFYQAWIVEGAYNILQARIDPPPVSAGLRLMSPSEPGFFWQLIVFFATLAFVGWALRQVDLRANWA
ncbi:MAG: PH domain-containing protein [Caldilineaceae bacterium]